MAERPRGVSDILGDAASTAFTALSTMALLRSIPNPYVKGFVAGAITLNAIRSWNANRETRQNVNEETRQNVNEEIPQGRLIEGVAEEGGIMYKQEVVSYSQEPYTVRYSDPTYTITGIACVPLSAEIQSPVAKVTEGGINCNYVTIRLTPVERGKWACKISICVKQSAAKPAIEAPQQAIQKAVKQDDELSVKEDIQQTIKQAVQEAVQEVVKQTVEEAVQAVQQSFNQVIQEAVQQTAQLAVQESVQQPAQQVIQQADQQDTQQAVKQRRRRRRRRTQNQVSCNST